MMMPKSPTDRYAEYLRDHLHTLVAGSDELTREFTQTSIWLVGLASGFLGLFVAKPESFASAGRLGLPLVITAVAVIVLGVAMRLVQQVISAKERIAFFFMHLVLSAITEESTTPPQLQDWWKTEDIVSRIREYFDADYSLLVAGQVPIEKAREVYEREYKYWQEDETEKKADLEDVFRAFRGEPLATTDERVQSSNESHHLVPIRTVALSIKRWSKFRTVLYRLMGLCFAASAILLSLVLVL